MGVLHDGPRRHPGCFRGNCDLQREHRPGARAESQQAWPTRPIRLVVGAGAGGGTDIAARIVAQSLTELLGQPVVVENRPGAGGTAAAEAVAKSPKDGYTAYMMSNSHAISAAMYKTLRYDPLTDFQMVSHGRDRRASCW